MTPLLIDDRAPLYRRVLGEAWDSLPAPLQTMHDVQSERSATALLWSNGEAGCSRD